MRQISVEEAARLLAAPDSPQLVDCREPWEQAHCALPGSLLAPLGEILEHVEGLDPDRPVIVYCHHGVRSLSGAVMLAQAGFDAVSMAGGIDAWSLRVDPGVRRY